MGNPVAHIRKAELLLDQNRPSEAEKQIAEVLREDPNNDQALSLLARCKYDQRKYNEGIDIVNQAIGIDPLHDYYFYLLGFGYYQLSQTDNARLALTQALSLNPYAPDYYGLTAMVLIEDRSFEEALLKANEGLALDATNVTCLNARATSLNKLKRTDDAIQTMEYALSQDPENDFTHVNAGWNLLEKGKYRQASSHFTEALRLNPNLENARAGLKESLKSAIPPYRWLLQYSFWVNNQNRQMRWVVPVILYVAVRIILGASRDGGSVLATVGIGVVVFYLAVVFLSWIINPLANLFLLASRRGRYALSISEKYNSLLLVLSMLLALGFFCLSLLHPSSEEYLLSPYLFCALICLTLGIPLGHMDFPFTLANRSRMNIYSICLVLLGLVALFLSLIDASVGFYAVIGYGIAFVAYTWMNALSSR